MKYYSIAAVLLLSASLLMFVTPSEAIDFDLIVNRLVGQITQLWQNNNLSLFGHDCFYIQKPRIRSWELYFQGRFFCPGLTAIRGEALTRSMSGVMSRTVTDFLYKARDAGAITEQQATQWLAGFED